VRRVPLILALALLVCGFAFGQVPDASTGHLSARNGQVDPQFGRRRDEAANRRLEKEREKQANKERQVRIKRDTDKLLELATELKKYVDKTNENVLSVEVIRKAEEIEKLAHDVRKRMKE
jgi:hypothetical protein